MKQFIIISIIAAILSLVPNLYGAKKVYDYGFEDWGGSIDEENTPLYIFNCSDEVRSRHENATEVITSYNANEMGQTWTAHSGSYFWIQNDASGYSLDPSIPGITAGSVNPYNHIGAAYPQPCYGNSNFDMATEITTGEFFIRCWARFNKGWRTIGAEGGGMCKWFRVYDTGMNINNQVYIHLTTNGISPDMKFYCANEGGWLGSSAALSNAYDGNWHKFSFYIDYNNGKIYGWYDVAGETLTNYTKYYDGGGAIGSATGAERIIIQGNFSAKNPVEETYHALDDIEIWDGMAIGPNPPKNLRKVPTP